MATYDAAKRAVNEIEKFREDANGAPVVGTYAIMTDKDGSQFFTPIAHDAVDSGSPMSIGGIAKSAQQTAVAAADRVKAVFNLYGEIVLAGYNWASNTLGVTEADPISSHHVEEILADETNGTDGTNYYYVDMDGFTGLNLHMELSGGAGTITATCEASWQDDGTAPASCVYKDITEFSFDDILDGTENAAYNADTLLALKSNINPKFVRVKIVSTTGDDSGDWTIYSKRWY